MRWAFCVYRFCNIFHLLLLWYGMLPKSRPTFWQTFVFTPKQALHHLAMITFLCLFRCFSECFSLSYNMISYFCFLTLALLRFVLINKKRVANKNDESKFHIKHDWTLVTWTIAGELIVKGFLLLCFSLSFSYNTLLLRFSLMYFTCKGRIVMFDCLSLNYDNLSTSFPMILSIILIQ